MEESYLLLKNIAESGFYFFSEESQILVSDRI